MKKMVIAWIMLLLCGQIAPAQNQYPTSGRVLYQKFYQGMDAHIAQWNFSKRVDKPLCFTTDVLGKENSALLTTRECNPTFETNIPLGSFKKGTIVTTFKVGDIRNRTKVEDDSILSYLQDMFQTSQVDKLRGADIFYFYNGVYMKLDKDLNVLGESVPSWEKRRYKITQCFDLGIRTEEWMTAVVTFEPDSARTTYYVNGRKAMLNQVLFNQTTANGGYLGYTQVGDVSINDVAIYNRLLTTKEIVALTGTSGESALTNVEPVKPKLEIMIFWFGAYVQIGFAVLFLIINVLTKRWSFRGNYLIMLTPIIFAYVHGMLPVYSVGNFFFQGEPFINFPDTFLAQIDYVTRYYLPGVMVSLLAYCSASFVKADLKIRQSSWRKYADMAAVYIGIPLLCTGLGTIGAFILLAFIIYRLVIAALETVKETNYVTVHKVRVSTGQVVDSRTGGPMGLLIYLGVMLIVVLLVGYVVSTIIIWLFNFMFIYQAIRNYFRGKLND